MRRVNRHGVLYGIYVRRGESLSTDTLSDKGAAHAERIRLRVRIGVKPKKGPLLCPRFIIWRGCKMDTGQHKHTHTRTDTSHHGNTSFPHPHTSTQEVHMTLMFTWTDIWEMSSQIAANTH